MSKNRMTGGGAGGGPGSRSLAKVTTYMTGRPSERTSPRGVSQYGSSIGNHATDSGKMLTKGVEPVVTGALPNHELGNECAVNTKCGPGGSRTVMPAGGQAQHGPVAGTVRPPGRSFDDRSK